MKPKDRKFTPDGWERDRCGFCWHQDAQVAESVGRGNTEFGNCEKCKGSGRKYVYWRYMIAKLHNWLRRHGRWKKQLPAYNLEDWKALRLPF